jgi:hypothetical protein
MIAVLFCLFYKRKVVSLRRLLHIAGGVGSKLAGGSFRKGALAGGIVAGLNHAAHEIGSDLQQKQQETLEQQIQDKLSAMKIGESISGKELGRLIGKSEVSIAISKVTRVNETTFKVNRILITGNAVLKDSPIVIEKTSISINNKMESVYKFTIDYKQIAISQGALPVFYINNNDILFYDTNGRLRYGNR